MLTNTQSSSRTSQKKNKTYDDLEDQDRSVELLSIVRVFDNKQEEESKDIEECLRKIDSLFKDGIFTDQEDTVVEKEVATVEKEVVVEEEEVAKNEKEKEDSIEKIVTTSKSMGTSIDNLERSGARPAEVAEITNVV
ncbi:hypothetical protein PVK06_005450 [Gossypium arboreum]|uniref:Uncharacterized protein n=1 Tax=Gossypium arboreum TaxID=29729 RepID=A0ABR0QVZ4_GOSAR|nr:hypothetical protein PVK06_005450 [Gossypium arboreum]